MLASFLPTQRNRHPLFYHYHIRPQFHEIIFALRIYDYFCLETSKTEASVCVQAVDKSVSFLQSFWLCQQFYPANQDQRIKPAIENPMFNTNFASGDLQNHIKPAQNLHLVLDVPILFMCLPNYLRVWWYIKLNSSIFDTNNV